jgi:4-diphosphocytidyl-2-C-methyl-D-erythritol kinase
VKVEKQSPCKVNLLLNILGRRPDGFHELETVMYPIQLFDHLELQCIGEEIKLTCSDPILPTDSRNLVYRAADAFLKRADLKDGIQIHLDKRIPLAAGLGGGSGNAATTLLALNELFDSPLTASELQDIAASLGSDIPFFLQSRPALATGRGEIITSLDFFPSLKGAAFLLIHPGFGIAASWAYQQLAKFPEALNGRAGRARELITALSEPDFGKAAKLLYNSLEAPALKKFPILQLFQEFLREQGTMATLMSGSGSTTFAIAESVTKAEQLSEGFRTKFGKTNWIAVVPA